MLGTGCWVLGAGCWVLVLGCRLLGLGSGLFLLRLRRREYKPVSIKPGVRFGLLGMGADDLALKSDFDDIRYPAGVADAMIKPQISIAAHISYGHQIQYQITISFSLTARAR